MRPDRSHRGKLTVLLAFGLALRLLLNGAPAAATTNPSPLLTYPMPPGCVVGSFGVHGIFALGFGPDGNLYGNTAMSTCELQINPSSGAYSTYPDTLGGGEAFNYLTRGISVRYRTSSGAQAVPVSNVAGGAALATTPVEAPFVARWTVSLPG